MPVPSKSPEGLKVGPPQYPLLDANAIFTVTATLTPGAQATITCGEQTFTPTAAVGLRSTDYVVLVSYPAPTNNANPTGTVRVSANDTLAVMYANPTAGSLTPPAGTYVFLVIRPQGQ